MEDFLEGLGITCPKCGYNLEIEDCEVEEVDVAESIVHYKANAYCNICGKTHMIRFHSPISIIVDSVETDEDEESDYLEGDTVIYNEKEYTVLIVGDDELLTISDETGYTITVYPEDLD